MELYKEIGKWLLDISKYLITAFLLTTAFGDMNNPWIVLGVIFSAILTFGLGVFLLRNSGKGSFKVNNKKKTFKKR